MKVNFKRILSAATALLIIGLVIIIILQYKQMEQFMNLDKDIEMTGSTLKTIPDATPAQCEEECKKNPACMAANIKTTGNGCWLKSNIDNIITNPSMAALRFPCELYDKPEFASSSSGSAIGLDEGQYSLSDLKQRGYKNNTVRSIKIRDGYKITIFDKSAFSGKSISFTTSQSDLSEVILNSKVEPNIKWSDAVSSLKIEKTY